MNRNIQITMRVSEQLKSKIDSLAENEGLPYQTFINSVLYKFCDGQFVEESKINKVVDMLLDRFSIRKRAKNDKSKT